MLHRNLSRSRLSRKQVEPAPVNPSESLLNLADAMLVLAVGIMLALVINWNIDVEPRQPGLENSEKLEAIEEVESGAEPDLEQLEELGKGVIYVDPHSGEIYLLAED